MNFVIETDKIFNKRIKRLFLMFTPLAGLFFLLASQGKGTDGMIALMVLLGFVVWGIALLPIVLRGRWVTKLDDEGVTLRNGRKLAWTKFERMVVWRQRGRISNYDLVFAGGTGSVRHLLTPNRIEVEKLMNDIMLNQDPFAGLRLAPKSVGTSLES
jgi:hypothetical protein